MGVSSPMSKTRPKQGIGKKWGDIYNVSKTIVKQGIKGSLGYCANRPIGVSPPMYKTGSKKIIEEKWGDISNVFKTLRSKALREVWDIEPMGQCTLGSQTLKEG